MHSKVSEGRWATIARKIGHCPPPGRERQARSNNPTCHAAELLLLKSHTVGSSTTWSTCLGESYLDLASSVVCTFASNDDRLQPFLDLTEKTDARKSSPSVECYGQRNGRSSLAKPKLLVRSNSPSRTISRNTELPSERPIKVYPPPPSVRSTCKEPINALTRNQLTGLDPSGVRSRLFAKRNPEAAKVGDILLVRQRNGDPFAGVCLNIRRQGIDTAILLRNNLTRVGLEMWYKIYSPNVEGIEVVQRRVKRARRARLYYMRQPKHDLGSVQNIVSQYLQQRQALRSGDAKGRGSNAGKRKHVKSK